MQVDRVKFTNHLNPPYLSRGIFYFCTLFLLGAVHTYAQPKATVEEPKKSFGKVKKGDKVTLVYKIINTGDQPLIIEDASATCHCTSASYNSKPVAPGASTTIQVTFDTKSAYGRQDRIVEVHSNDPKSPVRLRFKGTVDQD